MDKGFSSLTTMSVDSVAALQKVLVATGLSMNEAKDRLETFGRNEITSSRSGPWRIFARQFASSFVYLLLAAVAISWFLGEHIDAIVILAFVMINALISFYQEYRSEQTIKLLKRFIQPKTNVRRDGKIVFIDVAELVPGDIVLLKAGDMIPADVRFVRADNLVINESPLTGESIAVAKTSEVLKKETKEIYQAENIGFSGTTVVKGYGEGIVFATAMATVLGNVAQLSMETVRVSGFQQELKQFSNFVLKTILVTLVLVFVVHLLIRGTQTNILELIIFSIALAVSVVPEALPVVTTFSLSHGALKLAKKKVVVKRLSAIEDLGSIEVLCTDKTGTLTENDLNVIDVVGPEKDAAAFYGALGAGLSTKEGHDGCDPFDLALFSALTAADRKRSDQSELIDKIPFDPERRRSSVLVRQGSQEELIVRGAPESVLALCESMSASQQKTLSAWIESEGRLGHRVLAVARKAWKGASTYAVSDECALLLVGLVSFVDPIKPSTKGAIHKAKRLGVTIKIITGDSREVAGAVAFEVGLIASPDLVVTGDELEKMSMIKRHEAVETYHVFARVSPEQKFEIIQLLQEKHQVGFLGEGINDAPALKIANVAIVVQSASDIAREAADIVLLQSSLSVIVDGILEGRIVFANTLKYIKATLASNFGNFYAVAIASFLIPYLPLLPLQILLVNFLTDFPMIAIAADTIDPGEMKGPETYHIKDIVLFTTLIGLVSTLFDLIFFALFRPYGPAVLQTSWLIGSVLTELVFLFSVRSRLSFFKASRPAPVLIYLSLFAVIIVLVLPFTTLGAELFKFATPTGETILLIFGVVFVYFCVTELMKLVYYRFEAKQKAVIAP